MPGDDQPDRGDVPVIVRSAIDGDRCDDPPRSRAAAQRVRSAIDRHRPRSTFTSTRRPSRCVSLYLPNTSGLWRNSLFEIVDALLIERMIAQPGVLAGAVFFGHDLEEPHHPPRVELSGRRHDARAFFVGLRLDVARLRGVAAGDRVLRAVIDRRAGQRAEHDLRQDRADRGPPCSSSAARPCAWRRGGAPCGRSRGRARRRARRGSSPGEAAAR